MIEVQLTQGKIALIDDIDADLAKFKWCYHYIHSENCYVERKFNKKNYYMHRVILERMLSHPIDAGMFSDHINGNGLDNRRSNLRIVTQSQNQHNRKRNAKNRSSIYKGVTKINENKWIAKIKFDRLQREIGTFETEIDAAMAYDQAARIQFGEYARLNFQSPCTTVW